MRVTKYFFWLSLTAKSMVMWSQPRGMIGPWVLQVDIGHHALCYGVCCMHVTLLHIVMASVRQGDCDEFHA
jgi:hypothetical protein